MIEQRTFLSVQEEPHPYGLLRISASLSGVNVTVLEAAGSGGAEQAASRSKARTRDIALRVDRWCWMGWQVMSVAILAVVPPAAPCDHYRQGRHRLEEVRKRFGQPPKISAGHYEALRWPGSLTGIGGETYQSLEAACSHISGPRAAQINCRFGSPKAHNHDRLHRVGLRHSSKAKFGQFPSSAKPNSLPESRDWSSW